MKTESTNQAASFYIAIILYKSSSDAPDYQPLYQESFVLKMHLIINLYIKKALC